MSKELIVSATRHETRVAILEDDQVVEIFHQREKEYSLAGSIHKGRVTRVLPGMQSAFVDIGLERDAFLYVSDFFEDNDEYDKIVSGVEEKVLKLERGATAGLIPVPTPIEPETAAIIGAVPGAILNPPSEPAQTTTQPHPAEGRDSADRRGGRGRRGRRRRPTGGLPESKFFSPRENRPHRSEVRSVDIAPEEPSAEPKGGLMVLPGESISKYVGQTTREEESDTEDLSAAELAREVVEQAHVEAEIDSVQESEEEKFEVDADVEPEGITLVSEVVSIESIEEPTESEEFSIEAAAEPAIEMKELFIAEVQVEEVEDISDDPGSSVEDAAEEAADGVHEGPGEIAETEGPEPARIPHSLTAALREHGGRLPHRMSRRMRRKMRGDRPGDAPNGQDAAAAKPESSAAPAPVEEIKTPTERVARPQRAPRPEEREVRPTAPSITDLLRAGQEIIVQIAKEPLGQKGARITSHIALPGRFLVYMPTVDHIGVSRKIPSDEERQRLKRILQSNRSGIPGGFIVRTAGESRSEDELRADMMFLYNLWLDMRSKAEKRPAPTLLHHDLDVVERILRDQLTSAFKTVWVDNELIYESVLSFVQRFQPQMVGRIKLYTRPTPIFDEFGVTQELEKALRPKVWLKSGGYIVINQTEALVAIDINTGKYVGKSNRLEDTIVKINTDAIKEIVRQIRLRDLGGIIVVDFIDMDERKNRQKVMQALEESMRVDRAPYKILQFNDFGLVAITRKRVKQSLERTLCAPCPYCEGAGYVKSVGTVIGEILQEAHKIAKAAEGDTVLLRVNPEVAKVLKSSSNDQLEEIEATLGKTVLVKSDPLLHQTKFDLA